MSLCMSAGLFVCVCVCVCLCVSVCDYVPSYNAAARTHHLRVSVYACTDQCVACDMVIAAFFTLCTFPCSSLLVGCVTTPTLNGPCVFV